MAQKKLFYQKSSVKFLLLMVVLGVASWQVSPLLQPLVQKRIESFFDVNIEEEARNSIKTTRDIPEDANLGAYLAGYVAQNNKDIVAVQTYLEKVYEKDMEFKDVERDLFDVYLLNGEVEKAVPLAHRIIQNDADHLFSKYIIVVDLIKQKKYQEALDLMNGQFANTNEMQLFCYLKVWCYAGLKNEKQAFEVLRSVPVNAQLGLHKYHKALLLDYFGHQEEALAIYKTILPKDVSSLNTVVSVISALQKAGEWHDGQPLYEEYKRFFLEKSVFYVAVSQLKNPVIHTPEQAVGDIFYTISNALAVSRYNRLALMLNHIGAFIDGKSNLIKITSAELFQKMDMLQQANETYATIQPFSDLIRYRMAINEMALGNPRGAIRLFLKINSRDFKNPRVQYMLGLGYLQLEEYQRAFSYFNTAIQQYKLEQRYLSIPPILLFQAHIYQEQKNFPKMFEILEEALALDNQNTSTLNFLGYELIDRDEDAVRGLQLVKQAFYQKPEDLHIMDSLAWGYYKTGDYAQALRYAEMVVNKMSGNALANMHLGDIYQALGRYREAESQYRKALTAKQDMTPQLTAEINQKLEDLITQ